MRLALQPPTEERLRVDDPDTMLAVSIGYGLAELTQVRLEVGSRVEPESAKSAQVHSRVVEYEEERLGCRESREETGQEVVDRPLRERDGPAKVKVL